MKNLLLTLLLALLTVPASMFGQETEIDYLRKIFSMEKRAMAESFIQLQGSDYNAFWETYDAFEVERQALADKRVVLIKDYADQYYSMTNEQANQLVQRSIKINKDWMSLLTKYYKKMAKAVDAKTATSWYQFEQYIQTAVTYDLYESIPFVGE